MPSAERPSRETSRALPYTRPADTALQGTSPYTPINSENGEFRLLQLEPGDFDDELVMRLTPGNLSDDYRRYEALSYVWGTTMSPRTATLDGIPIEITANLDSAFRHLRGALVPRVLWVDALSTNQKDTQERNHQVQIMGQINSGAREVIIWLGPVDMQDRNLRAILGAMQLQFSSENGSAAALFAYMTSVLLLVGEQIGVEAKGELEVLHIIHNIIERSWFFRLWVVQELALSKKATIRLGRFSFPWQPFESFVQWLPGHKVGSCYYPWLAYATGRVAKLAHTQPFASQLFRTLHLSATDPRDKVFGILGISTFHGARIEPDYTKTVQQVYIDAACRVLSDDNLALYYYAPLQAYSDKLADGPRSKKTDGLPSWVPDFSIGGAQYLENMVHSVAGSNTTYHGPPDHRPYTILCSTDRQWRVIDIFDAMIQRLPFPPLEISTDGTKLIVPGNLVGTVAKTSGDLLWNLWRGGLPALLKKLSHLYHSFAEPYGITRLGLIQALLEPWSRAPCSRAPWFEQERYNAVVQLSTSWNCPEGPAMEILLADIQNNAQSRIFYTTADGGAFGLTHHPDPHNGIRPGDVVVGLFGINFPFILRPNEDGTYTMVNVAGVHGHKWGHDFLQNTEATLKRDETDWSHSSRGRGTPTATWKDYERYGMREFVIV